MRKAFDTMIRKKKINNITFFTYFHRRMIDYNSDPKSPLFKKLDDDIAKFKENHYTVNREWRYNYDKGEMR